MVEVAREDLARERLIPELLKGECSTLVLVGKGELALADSVSELDARKAHRCGVEGLMPGGAMSNCRWMASERQPSSIVE
jgi:hypothetical protein